MHFFFLRKTKKLSYEITSNTQLLGVKDEIQGKVQVLYEGEEVKNVHLLTLKFSNTGNQSISSADYERPLSIQINTEAKILTHEIVEEEPENLGVEVNLDENKLFFSPVLLNAKDSFSVKALISDFEAEPEVDGRIIGVKSISKYSEGQVAFILIMLFSLILIGLGAPNMDKDELILLFGIEISKGIIGGVLFGAGYLLILFGMLRNKRILKMTREILKVGLGR